MDRMGIVEKSIKIHRVRINGSIKYYSFKYQYKEIFGYTNLVGHITYLAIDSSGRSRCLSSLLDSPSYGKS